MTKDVLKYVFSPETKMIFNKKKIINTHKNDSKQFIHNKTKNETLKLNR